jgi:arginine decarboxylase
MASEKAISSGQLRINEARRLMEHLESSMNQSTYLQN